MSDGLLVSPHARSELLWQTRVGPQAGPGLRITTAHVLDADAPQRHFLTAGPIVTVPLEKGPVISAVAEWPFTTARRLEWRLGAGVTLGL